MSNTFLTVEFAPSYGISLQSARRLNDEEKKRFWPEYQDYMMVSVGPFVELDYVSWTDLCELLGEREPDGEFAGCNNRVYTVTQAQWDALVALDRRRAAQRDARNQAGEEAALYAAKADAEKQMVDGRLPGAREAAKIAADYRDALNEGAEGYIPRYYTQAEYDRICARLNQLNAADQS